MALGGVAALALVLGASPAAAWELARTDRGAPVRWFAREAPLPFKVGATPPGDVALEVVTAVVQTAWGTWHQAGCDDVPTAAYRGLSPATDATRPESLRATPDNVVVFVPTEAAWSALGRSASEVAITLVSNNDRTGEIVDADILVNDGPWRFTLTASTGGVPGQVDLASVMTHEVGHALGLLHSADPTATMYPTYTGVEPSGARTLADDDREGLCELYAGVPAHVEGELVEHCVGTPGPWAYVVLWLIARRARRARRASRDVGEAGPAGPAQV
ncbi:MAG: matrixin family metalloprotease [Deltaproteobacteria bacterium]|nr:matrixin family metalloprotease [Deltaproteobacteria bacterium]